MLAIAFKFVIAHLGFLLSLCRGSTVFKNRITLQFCKNRADSHTDGRGNKTCFIQINLVLVNLTLVSKGVSILLTKFQRYLGLSSSLW